MKSIEIRAMRIAAQIKTALILFTDTKIREFFGKRLKQQHAAHQSPA